MCLIPSVARSGSDVDSASLPGELRAPPAAARRALPALGALPPAYFVATLAGMLILHFACPVVQWNLGVSRLAGLPFALLGIAFVVTSVRQFRSVTTLMPFEQPSALVTRGFFRVSRNPMYTGLLLSILGAVIMLGSATPALAIPLFAGLMQTRFIAHEERVLEHRFGEAYRDYRKRVRRWL
jgi:protein-S-isoprenylcysteine O-methyltransferase Ste14